VNVRDVIKDRDEWVKFLGHMVLGLLTLSAPLYFAAKSVAGDVADEHVAEVKATIATVQKDVVAGQIDRAQIKSSLADVSGDINDVKKATDSINSKLDKIIDRQLDAAARNGH
jgi:septal ring factor EnvC (AmiA/AmiB activator)